MNYFLLLLVLVCSQSVAHAMSEEHRLEEYHARGYEWPLPSLNPNTDGWKNIMYRRFEQISRVEDSNKRYNGWIQVMSSALTSRNFTENG